MEKTMRIAGVGMNKNFVEDSPQNSAKPVASSTFMVSKTEFDFKDFDNTFPSLKQVSTSALSTTSSLGVIDLEKQSLLSEREENESFRLSRNFVSEQRALSISRFKERINDISVPRISNEGNNQNDLNSIKINSVSSHLKSNESNDVTTDISSKNCYGDARKSSLHPNLFDNVSNVSSPILDSSFESGNLAVLKLEADQKENRKQFGSLPVSPIDISMDSENLEEREKQFSEFVKSKCYSPEEISDVLRNKLTIVFKENSVAGSSTIFTKNNGEQIAETNNISRMDLKTGPQLIPKISIADNEMNDVKNSITDKIMKEKIQSELQTHRFSSVDVKTVPADSTFFNDTLEESRASSIASINQIAAALRRKSLMAEPRLAIEHLLSIGKTKSKCNPLVTHAVSSNSKEIPCSFSSTSTTAAESNYSATPNPSQCSFVNTPSTITCPARNFTVDSVTGKVFANDVPNFKSEHSFITARQLLDVLERKSSSFYSPRKIVSKMPTKYFSLAKSISPLEVIDEQEQFNNLREFWKLNPARPDTVNENNFPNESLNSTSELMNQYCKRTFGFTQDHAMKTDNFLSNSIRTNGIAEPVHRISFNHNLTDTLDSMEADTLDADSSSEVIYAGKLCVGTQVEVIIVIENPTEVELNYRTTLKSIHVDGCLNFAAASVMLVSEYPNIILLPKTENEIKVMLSPLLQEKIEVVLEFISEEKKFSNIIRRIKFTGEKPKLKLENLETCSFSFGLIPEGSSKSFLFRLKNEGTARLPLKLILQEENQMREFSARTMIESSGIFECSVCLKTPELPNDSPNSITVEGQLLILLDTVEEETLSNIILLEKVSLFAQIAKINLLINDGTPLVLNCSPTLKSAVGQLKVRNNSILLVEGIMKRCGSHMAEFIVEPSCFKLLPNNERLLKVTFKPNSSDQRREIELQFDVSGSKRIISTKVTAVLECNTTSPSLTTPVKLSTETCTTPHSNSSSSSSNGADGPMELDCTHSSISWGSVQLHTKNIQTITLRNRNTQREKLLLAISDSNGSFKFVENEFYYRDLKLTLEPKESRKISVLFMPFIADQAVKGKILIMRRHSLESSIGELKKRIIPLYGIGGRVKIAFTGIFRDNENRSWITPDSDTFETKFTVENSGDSVAFVKFISEDLDDSLAPDEIILLPAESAEVNFALHLNKDRLDLLHKQNPQKEIFLVNKLTVFWGCESTRLRLKKLWNRFKEFENIQRIRDKVEILVDMNSNGKVDVDSLQDSQSMLSMLWYDDVVEQTIGVLISHEHLDSACLDSTVVFKDLIDHTTVL